MPLASQSVTAVAAPATGEESRTLRMATRRPARRKAPRRPATRGAASTSSRYEGGPRIVAVVLASVLVLALVGGAAGLGSNPDPQPEQDVQGTEVDAEGEELLDLLAAGRDGTFHASFDLVTPGSAIDYRMEVHRSEGRVREELVVPAASGEERRLTIFDGDTSASCVQPAGGLWTCAAVDQAQPRTDTIFGAFDRATVIGRDVTATDEDVAGRTGRCFEVRGLAGRSSICLSPEGIPLRLETGGVQFMLTAIDPVVDAAVFLPPAPVT